MAVMLLLLLFNVDISQMMNPISKLLLCLQVEIKNKIAKSLSCSLIHLKEDADGKNLAWMKPSPVMFISPRTTFKISCPAHSSRADNVDQGSHLKTSSGFPEPRIVRCDWLGLTLR